MVTSGYHNDVILQIRILVDEIITYQNKDIAPILLCGFFEKKSSVKRQKHHFLDIYDFITQNDVILQFLT